MPEINSDLMVASYVTDFGEEITNLNFKFEVSNAFSDAGSVTGAIYAPRAADINCGTNKLFSPRKAKILFKDGSSTELPIPSLDDVVNAMTNALGYGETACVSLIGERWSAIPPAKLGGSYNNGTIANSVKPPTTQSLIQYTLEGGDVIQLKRSFYTEPQTVWEAQTSCIVLGQGGNACSFGGSIDMRHFLGKIATTTGKSIARKIFVSASSASEIKQCGADVMDKFNCLGYQGTSIADASFYY